MIFSLLGENSELPKQLELSFTVNGEVKKSILQRERGAFGEEAKVTFGKENGEEVVAVPEIFAYFSKDKNWILTFHGDNKFDGLLFDNNGKDIFHFVSEKGELKLNNDIKKLFPGEIKSKGRELTNEANGIDYWDDCHPAQSKGLARLDIGIAIGNVMFQSKGTDLSLELASSFITLSNAIYERQLDISLSIQDTFVATEPNLENFLPGTCSQSIQNQLSRFASWNKPSNQVLWHLLDDCFGASGGILGIAYLGTLCSRNNVGVTYLSDHLYDLDEYPTWATVAHELGHNFDGQHSFEEGQGRTGGIMDYGFLKDRLIDGEIQFNSQYREREVCREVTSAVNNGCLVEGIAPSPTAQFTTIETPKVEVFAQQERKLTCSKHKNKMPSSPAHLTKFNNFNRIQCQKACAERENCNGFVFDRAGWCELLDQVNPETLHFTNEFDTFFCTEGKLAERFTKRDEDDVLDVADSDSLKKECCSSSLNQGYLGMNSFYRESLTAEECQEACVKNSRCEAVTYVAADTSCMFFGGKEFSHETTFLQGAETLSCDRSCVASSAIAAENGTESVGVNAGALVGSIGLIVGLVAGVVAAIYYKKKNNANKSNAQQVTV